MAGDFSIYLSLIAGRDGDSGVCAWWENCMQEKGWLFIHRGSVDAPTLAELVENAMVSRGLFRAASPHLKLLNTVIEGAPKDEDYSPLPGDTFEQLSFYITGRNSG